MSIRPLSTTVVGSFPAAPDRDSLVNDIRKGEDPFLQSIDEAVDAQTSAGIDIIADGQTRNDMIKLFTTKLAGIRMKGKPVVIGDIGYREPIILNDQKYLRSIAHERQIKGIITGPFTLAMSCRLSSSTAFSRTSLASSRVIEDTISSSSTLFLFSSSSSSSMPFSLAS